MKKIIVLAFMVIICTHNIYAQDSTDKQELSQLLNSYLGIEDALVSGNAAIASVNAEKLIKTLNSIDYKIISEGNIGALLKDATAISDAKELKSQRVYFSNLSVNIIALAKAVRLNSSPVYEVYCPMKKAYWLSSDKSIKNPYFGSSMLTCGNITETIQ